MEFSVSDEGSGIAPERIAQLFRKYSVGDDAAKPGAAGLGLAICKGLVEAHGGRIRAESAGVGLGACFTFSLPVVAEAAVGGRGPEVEPRRGAGRILVVDDDPQMLRFIREALTEAGFAPIVMGNHQELAQVIRVDEPDLVLLDLVLSGKDGLELMQEVPELADIPVIFISAYGRGETIARALDVGAADYVVKPFASTELTARIRAVLRRHVRPDPFTLGQLAIDFETRLVTVAGDPLTLTATEYDLLRTLALNAGKVLTFASLLRQVWHAEKAPTRNPCAPSSSNYAANSATTRPTLPGSSTSAAWDTVCLHRRSTPR